MPESTALRSDKVLDVLYSTPARFVSHAPCISGHLHPLASRPCEKCGLAIAPGSCGTSFVRFLQSGINDHVQGYEKAHGNGNHDEIDEGLSAACERVQTQEIDNRDQRSA